MPLSFANPATRRWFERSFDGATRAQELGWGPIAQGASTLLLAPTGSGKTLAAFLVAIDRLLFDMSGRDSRDGARDRKDDNTRGVRVLYVSPLKALAVDVERNLRAPLAGISAEAEASGVAYRPVTVGVRSGDTTPREREKMKRTPPDVLITTPESLYLLLTSQAAAGLAHVETVIVDEIHSLVPTKRGAHMALSMERLEALRGDAPPLQRIGLSATQRPLDEVARYLGGYHQGTPRPVTIVDAGSTKEFDLRVEVPVEDMARLGPDERADAFETAPASASALASASAPAPAWDPAPASASAAKPASDFDDFADPIASAGPGPSSIWPAIHPQLVRLIREHRSTMIFANSRRLAERLAAAINDLAGEELALAHHGSIAKDIRANIEDRLKRGLLPAIVATSSLELGIDIGAVDLVIQIEAPLSVASGIQRIGRAGHQVGAVSRGIVFPKYRGDLLACAAVTEHIQAGKVESTHYPRNAIDVLAQQVVAIVASAGAIDEETLFELVRGASPYAELRRSSFDSVLDMLSGRYPSEEFSELRPRVTWDRVGKKLTPRKGSKLLAIANAGTIPDRGLYGVFLANSEKPVRVGELDEEMVFESREGDVFLLGASSWRIEEITHDRVNVSPAPGVPGKMPFWHGDRPGRPAEFGRAIGELTRELLKVEQQDAIDRLTSRHGLDARAADNLLRYLLDQREATGHVPSDERIVIERFHDEIGDLCVVILSPFGARVHAPWATAVRARLLSEHGAEADVIHGDDGIVFRLVDGDATPDDSLFIPDPVDVEAWVTGHLSETALFAARFRENAGRALLLPRRRPGQRTPLWAQRRKSAGLLKVASAFRDFPIVLETYRECLQDVFDLPELVGILQGIKSRKIRITHVQSKRPSPFASALMFNYVAAFMYEGDAPLAERRAQALSLDQAQLRALLGEPELRELLEADAVREVEAQVSRSAYAPAHVDAVHDRLLSVGDRSRAELFGRALSKSETALSGSETALSGSETALSETALSETALSESALSGSETALSGSETALSGSETALSGSETALSESASEQGRWLEELMEARRIVPITVAGDERFIAIEDVARYRDALGIVPPRWAPHALLMPVPDALEQLVARFAKTHGPFRAEAFASRYALGIGPVHAALRRLLAAGRIVEGEFLPSELLRERDLGPGQEYCDPEVLARLKRRSLAMLRRQIEAVDPATLGRFLARWQQVEPKAGHGADALISCIEQLQGAPMPASDLESRILPARVHSFDRRDLDELLASGELVWRGVQSLGDKDGRVALYLADHYEWLAPRPEAPSGALAEELLKLLEQRGALFFRDMIASLGRLTSEVFDALWDLVWAGHVTNDTFAPLRARVTPPEGRGARARSRSRSTTLSRSGPPGSEGRWSLLPALGERPRERRLEALCSSLLERYGVLTREAVSRHTSMHSDVGGFGQLYPVLKAMEEVGRVRRGYFVAGLGATQFALPGCEDRLRDERDEFMAGADRSRSRTRSNSANSSAVTGDAARERSAIVLAADDPANPYGAALPWPQSDDDSVSGRASRSAGAQVVLVEGTMAAFVGRGGERLSTFLPTSEPERSHVARALAQVLTEGVGQTRGKRGGGGVLYAQIDGVKAQDSAFAAYLLEAGFQPTGKGLYRRFGSSPTTLPSYLS